MIQMPDSNHLPWTLRARVAAMLCAALVANVALAATPKLESIAVTPAASSISVGQTQAFAARGTFSNGKHQVLGPVIADIAAGDGDTCVLLTGGGLECWGYNSEGELGDGSTTSSPIARQVVGIANAESVTVGGFHACALLASGAVDCWGFNISGQLGNGTNTNSSIPVSVVGITTATAVAAGEEYSCALLSDGKVRCGGETSLAP